MKRYYFSGDDSYEKPTLYLGFDDYNIFAKIPIY